MTKQKILLIGNGPSVFDSKRGHEVDDFKGKIVRVNNYEISGYEKYVGTRTDILIAGKLELVKQLQPQYDYILLYQSHLDGGIGLRKIRKLSPYNKVKFFPIYEKDRIKKILGLDHQIEPRTGIIAIYWFTSPDIELYLYGFDSSNGDYFSVDNINNTESSKYHNSEKESAYIEYLIELNLIKWF